MYARAPTHTGTHARIVQALKTLPKDVCRRVGRFEGDCEILTRYLQEGLAVGGGILKDGSQQLHHLHRSASVAAGIRSPGPRSPGPRCSRHLAGRICASHGKGCWDALPGFFHVGISQVCLLQVSFVSSPHMGI